MGGLEGPPKPPDARPRPGEAVARLDPPDARPRPGEAVARLDSPALGRAPAKPWRASMSVNGQRACSLPATVPPKQRHASIIVS
jgi:hypothetical protein